MNIVYNKYDEYVNFYNIFCKGEDRPLFLKKKGGAERIFCKKSRFRS